MKTLILTLTVLILQFQPLAADDIIPDSDMSANDQDSIAIQTDDKKHESKSNITVKETGSDPIYDPDKDDSVRYINNDGVVIKINDTLRIITND